MTRNWSTAETDAPGSGDESSTPDAAAQRALESMCGSSRVPGTAIGAGVGPSAFHDADPADGGLQARHAASVASGVANTQFSNSNAHSSPMMMQHQMQPQQYTPAPPSQRMFAHMHVQQQ